MLIFSSIFGALSIIWTSPVFGEETPESAANQVRQSLEDFKSSVTPEKVGDPLLDELLTDWYGFALGSIDDVLNQFRAPAKKPKTPEPENSTGGLPKDSEGFPILPDPSKPNDPPKSNN